MIGSNLKKVAPTMHRNLFFRGVEFFLEVLKLTVLHGYKITGLKTLQIEAKCVKCVKGNFYVIFNAIESILHICSCHCMQMIVRKVDVRLWTRFSRLRLQNLCRV